METVTTGTAREVDRQGCEPLSVGLTNRRKDGPRERAALPAVEQAHGDAAAVEHESRVWC